VKGAGSHSRDTPRRFEKELHYPGNFPSTLECFNIAAGRFLPAPTKLDRLINDDWNNEDE